MSEDKKEKPVEVLLPDDPVVEVELSDKKAEIKEETPVVSEKDNEVESEKPRKEVIDEREKALQDLRKQYEHQKLVAQAERDARKKAEEYARQQAEQVNSARTEVQDSNLKIILNAIDATEQAAVNAERDYAEAMQAGNYAAAAKAQRMMAQAESHLLQLNNGKQRLEESLQQPTEGSVRDQNFPTFEPEVPQDPVEIYASKLAPKSANWLRQHPDAVNKIGKLTRAHQDAVEDGISPESKEYFEFIEDRLGYSSNKYAEHEVSREVPTISKKSMTSTPVSSSGNAMSPRSSANSNTMVLSSDEVEMAILAEPELPREKAIESYARNKAFLIKQGKLSA
jgi:hypothetical protein